MKAVCLEFNSLAEFDVWHEGAMALAGIPDGRGTEKLTYPIEKDGKVYCFVPAGRCPAEALPATKLDVSSVKVADDGKVTVAKKILAKADADAFTEEKI
jgi:hypothetical protein